MRILANISEATGAAPDPQIIQVDSTPQVGIKTKINGKFIIHVPSGVSPVDPVTRRPVEIDSASPGILPINSHFINFPYTIGVAPALHTQVFAGLLAQFPNFNHLYFNPLVEHADLLEIDPGFSFPNIPPEPSRIQLGRTGGGVLPDGLAPNMVAILGANPAGPAAVLVTNTIDLLPFTAVGVATFMVYWKVQTFESTEDINSFAGFHGDSNNPAIKNQIETGEGYSSNFEVHLSNDNGVTFTQVNYLEPVTLGAAGTNVRIAFRNTGAKSKVYLANFAFMFAV